MRTEYELWHETLEPDYESEAPWHVLAKETLRQEMPLRGRLLEIACGRGGLACWIVRTFHGARVLAADVAISALVKAKALCADPAIVTFASSDVLQLPLKSEALDVVVSCETLEHVTQPYRAIDEISRVLRPGGLFVLTVPNYLSLSGLYRIYCWLRGRTYSEAGQPINHPLILPAVLRHLYGAGFTVHKVRTIGHYIPFPRGSGTRLTGLDEMPLVRWFGLHSLIVARRKII